MPSIGRRFRRTTVAIAATAALGVGLLTSLGPVPGGASSHLEAPLVAGDPQVDTNDFYMFVSPNNENTVTLISTWLPFEEPAGGPNFYAFAEGAHYDFNIDNDGDAVADIAYRFTFTNNYRNTETFLYNTGVVDTLDDPDLNFYQTYDLERIDDTGTTSLLDDVTAVPSRVGTPSMPDYKGLREDGIYKFSGGKALAGQADDPFFLDLRVFDLLYGLDFSQIGVDTLHGFNVNALAIRVQKDKLAKDGDPVTNPIIGGWATAERPSLQVKGGKGGSFVEVSRLGMPLVNEVVIPVGKKDLWNASRPQDDAQFLNYVNDPEVPHLVESIYGILAPDSDPDTDGIQRDDLIQVFLTGIPDLNQPPGVVASEQLRLNMSIAPCEPAFCDTYSRLGVIGGDLAGYPNGRRLRDDIIDISLQVMEGVLLGQDTGLGDAVDKNDHPFTVTFPYLALPFSGSSGSPHFSLKVI